ncbi:ABC transporter ATP-binding protein [Candidatus Binatus sp.]|uniref:ABC transporter ATP-binding protein n=1 Tax=Candidatus Binatus sp. TaxID=2811406 RepID=UPI003BAEAB49
MSGASVRACNTTVNPIIKIRGLGKQYRIGKRRVSRTLREAAMDSVTAPLRYSRSILRRTPDDAGNVEKRDTIWALRDLSLDVGEGEVLGVIGRNGGGKSTLLKVMSRITEPTTGRVDLHGRVGSLLEVGTGFHPELTGRENIFLSGAILGMRRNEIERKFDEIVAFAEMDQFVDTPVKHYSSGMYVRLGFAVAAHLETEIILIDEVLAVGDAAFQKKCLGKVGDVARQGRTVLYISHNMASVEALCDSCIYLIGGRLEEAGKPRDVIAKYMASQTRANSGTISLAEHPGRRPGYKPHLRFLELRSGAKTAVGAIRMGDPLTIIMSFEAASPLRPVVGVIIKTIQGASVCSVNDRFSMQLRDCKMVSRGTVVCEIDQLMLMPGQYNIDVSFGDFGPELDVVSDAISFDVLPADMAGIGRLPPSSQGPMYCAGTWKLCEDTDRL